MTSAYARRGSERRSEHLLNDLLDAQGWNRRRPPHGDVLFQSEYRAYPELAAILQGASKSGTGFGIPEALLVDRASHQPLGVIEAKPDPSNIDGALREAQAYAAAFLGEGYQPLAIALAGTDDTDFQLRVTKWNGSEWVVITYDGAPIGWIPTIEDIARVSAPAFTAELRPSMPPPEVLAGRAEEINRLLRESDVRDEFRPAVVAAIMVALWQAGRTGGAIRRDAANILRDINTYCQDAFGEKKFALANSLRIDPLNRKLAANARRIVSILERLNIAVLTAEHDYLGQLYETFFRYTGGNTIGQYFTPRHVTTLMTELTEIGIRDIVLDPACGSGGFLVAAMDRMLRLHGMKREQMVGEVAQHLIGFESEPVTAALCVANMILRGDGSSGIHQADALTSREFPDGSATVALLNPPFPHKKTDTPAEAFIDRALEGLKDGGRLAVIMPTSALAKKDKGDWRARVLKRNRLEAVCQLPDELFQPYASATTSIALITKGIAHDSRRKTVFVRLNHDGLVLRKSARVRRPQEPDQTEQAIEAIRNKTVIPGFSGLASIAGKDEWAVGAYIPSAPPAEDEVRVAVDVLLRRLASFYTRYAAEIVQQREAIADGDLDIDPYRDLLSSARLKNAASLPAESGTVGGAFDIFYGMKELHSRDGMVPGRTLIISPTEEYNGCYGWLEFPQLIEPPFVTVAQTGSIGEAFVQMEPCAVNDDCLLLLPRQGVSEAKLVLAAATLHAEKWRFSYGRKLTPQRIAEFKLPASPALERWVSERLAITREVIAASLKPYLSQAASGTDPDDEDDIADALAALEEPDGTSWAALRARFAIGR